MKILRRLWQLKYDIQIVPIIFTAVVIICYIIWHQQTFSYDIMQRAITLSFFDGCIRTDGLLRSCPFARTRSFSISADAPLTRENVVTSKTEKTISRCPFRVEMKREEARVRARWGRMAKGKRVGQLFFVSWKTANASTLAIMSALARRWNQFNARNSLPVISVATACPTSLCIRLVYF